MMLIAMKGKNLKNDIEKNTLHSTLQHLIYVKITLQIIIYFKKNTTYMYDIYNFSKRYGLYFFFYCFLQLKQNLNKLKVSPIIPLHMLY